MKRMLIAASLCVLSACGGGTRVQVLAPEELPADLYGRSGVPGCPRQVQLLVYFVQGDRLAAVSRTGTSCRPTPELVMRSLLQGPNVDEQAKGITTGLPVDVKLLGVSVRNRVATVDLSREFRQAAERRAFLLRVAEVVWSMDELPDVVAVRFLIDGEPESFPDQDGALHEQMARGRFSRLAPHNPEGPPVAEGPLVPDLTASTPEASP